jgi:hypothetical protein
MTPKKIASILSLIEISQNNLKMAHEQLLALGGEKGTAITPTATTDYEVVRRSVNPEEYDALEVVEGYFDGEGMIGDNGKSYPVPPNYASKTQLIIGDRMKRILTTTRESFKLIKPAERQRVVGTFQIDPQQDLYYVDVDGLNQPVRILKASATFAMKNMSLQLNDRVAIIIPKDTTPLWGALVSVVTGEETQSSEYGAGNFDSSELKPDGDFNAASYFDNASDLV